MTNNQHNQPIGEAMHDWAPRRSPEVERLEGHRCVLERLDSERHADDLITAFAASPASDWTYLPVGPFGSSGEYRRWLQEQAPVADPRHYAIIDRSSGRAVGTIALMRHDPFNGVIEVGWVIFSPLMQRSFISTEAHFLLMRYIFDSLQYRRYEWKCDSHNGPSRRAAVRLGFVFEGTFRQSLVYKNRSRDTSWYSIIDREWPQIKAAFESWFDPDNFDRDGQQKSPLAMPFRN